MMIFIMFIKLINIIIKFLFYLKKNKKKNKKKYKSNVDMYKCKNCNTFTTKKDGYVKNGNFFCKKC